MFHIKTKLRLNDRGTFPTSKTIVSNFKPDQSKATL